MFSRGIVGLVAIALLAVVVSGGRAVLAQDATPAPFVPEGVTGVVNFAALTVTGAPLTDYRDH